MESDRIKRGRISLDRALAYLEEARKVSDAEPLEEVVRRINRGFAHLWLGDDCVGVTEFTPMSLHIWLAGGDLKELLDMLPDVESFARFHGVNRVEFGGRKGWFRLFKRYGYVQEGDEMVKVLS
jgi:hypothetical protein